MDRRRRRGGDRRRTGDRPPRTRSTATCPPHDLYHSDGTTEGRRCPTAIAEPGWAFHEYAEGLRPTAPGLIDIFTTGRPARPVGSLGLWLDNWLVLAGRLSGRFVDEAYLGEVRKSYRLPL